MTNNILTLAISFNFSDWQNHTVETFRDNIKKFIGTNSARDSVLLSSELNKNGISFYLLTSDYEFYKQIQFRFGLKVCTDNIDLKILGYEYGNQDLILLN